MKKPFAKGSQLSGEQTGQSTVEFALTITALVLMIFAIIDLGRAMSIYSFLAGAAQAGARAGAISNDRATIEAAARERMTGFDSSSVTIDVNQSGNHTTVALTYVFEPVTPLVAAALGLDALTLSNTARSRKLGGGSGGGGPAPTSTSAPAATATPPPPTAVPTATTCWPPGKCNGGSTPVPTNTPVPVATATPPPAATATPRPGATSTPPPAGTPVPTATACWPPGKCK